MRRYLPIFLLVGALLIIVGVVFAFLNLRTKKEVEVEEEAVPEVPFQSRPFISLTPGTGGTCVGGSPDGSWLNLRLQDLKFPALEYILLYTTSEEIQQGVPSSLLNLGGETTLVRDILLGSESRGRCKYDKGVEQGTFTLKFRSVEGKFLGKLETGWHLQTKDTLLSSADGKFKLKLATIPPGFFLTMNTFGLPGGAPGEVVAGPYGVFASKTQKVKGSVEIEGEGRLFGWNGSSWVKLAEGKTTFLGVFILVTQ